MITHYKCKICGAKSNANSIAEIKSYGKLCDECLGKRNRSSLKRNTKINKRKKK